MWFPTLVTGFWTFFWELPMNNQVSFCEITPRDNSLKFWAIFQGYVLQSNEPNKVDKFRGVGFPSATS